MLAAEFVNLYPRHCVALLLSAGEFVDVSVAQVFFDDLLDEFVSFHEYGTHIFVCFDNCVLWSVEGAQCIVL